MTLVPAVVGKNIKNVVVNSIFSVISGLLLALSFNFSNLSLFSWFALVLFLYVIEKSNFKKGLLFSLLFGFSYFLFIFFWVGNVSIIGLFALLFYLCIYSVLFFIFSFYFLKRPLFILTIPSIWVILEFLRENIWCGFGWPNLGYTQYKNLYINQVADIFGVKFISFLIVMNNAVIYDFIFRKRSLKKLFIFFLIIIFCIIYSLYKLNYLKEDSYVKVSIVQPNFSKSLKEEKLGKNFILYTLKDMIFKTDSDSLVILPEVSWPNIIDEQEIFNLNSFVNDIKRDILIGAIRKEKDNFYNSCFYFNKNGGLLGIYDKIKLVPFGEYVPLRNFLTFIEVLNSIGDIERGKLNKKFIYKDKIFSIIICFEDIFSNFVSKLSKDIDFLVNITDDSWFGGNPEARQHLAILVFRAIENRISIVRCANSGISGVVMFTGRYNILKNKDKEVYFRDIFKTYIPIKREKTFYSRFKDIFCLFSFILISINMITQIKYRLN